MKGDFTRDSFRPEKHYQQVLMQQGRVQLDADWNEQAAIAMRRAETTAQDIVGSCGGPAETAAFGILTDPALLDTLPADADAPIRQFALSAGRYYVHGRQCEVESPFLFSWQPDHREPDALAEGDYLVYLDVWLRHVTMHEDGELREPALGGPDTGTRLQAVWQVRAAALDTPLDPDDPSPDSCQRPASEFDQRQRAALPRLAARTAIATPETDPCIVPANAGYRGLENQLYRVEIHRSGRLDEATFKWSRENGAVVTQIADSVSLTVNGVEVTRLTVVNIGPDENLSFKTGDLVEIIHDTEEREGIGGTLAKVSLVDEASGRITLAQFGDDPMPVPIDQASNPRLRRWEGIGAVTLDAAVNDGFLALENGLEIRFELPAGGEFRSGDYWQIPARTASSDARSGQIQWPEGNGGVVSLPPQGLAHHYCRLGVISVDADALVTPVSDCRCLWPSLAAVPRLFYLSGDGQAVMPDLTMPPGTRTKLPRCLTVGVANGHCLEQAVSIRFEVVNSASSPSDGWVQAAGESPSESVAIVPLDSGGLASADFYLDSVNPVQQVVARLLGPADSPVSLPVIFNASLSIASQVAYQSGDCAALAGQVNVQDAIDTLSGQASLYKAGGDAQTTSAGQTLPQEVVVLVANRCGPLRGVPVKFEVRSGGGSVNTNGPVTTGPDGRAACQWTLGPSTATQELEASIAENGPRAAAPTSVRFTARPSSGDTAQPGMRIEGVFTNADPLQLGAFLPLSMLKNGLRIDCDHEVDAGTVQDGQAERGEPTCFVTVEVPVPLTREQLVFWGDEGLVGYSPMVLAANVHASGHQIFWEPSSVAINGLGRAFAQMRQRDGLLGKQILARLTLKGNFIWAAGGDSGEEILYLDGEAFRAPRGNNEFGIQLPSGDDRRGGDFEIWFWLIAD